MEATSGEAQDAALGLVFDRRLKLEFHGTRITSDGGLLACRELDDTLGLSDTVSGWLGRDVWLGPPMEVCAGFELIVIENATARGHDVLEISKRGEVLVGEWLVEDGPEVLSRLKLGRVRGQVDGPDPIRNSQVGRGVPAGVVEPEHDDAIPSRPGFTG